MKCPTRWCRNKKAPKKRTCHKCAMREWRRLHPISDRLADLKKRAKRKKLDFNLDLEWLTNFLEGTGYDPSEHHIDRISAGKGYVKGNLQVLPIADNIAKGNRERGSQLQIL